VFTGFEGPPLGPGPVNIRDIRSLRREGMGCIYKASVASILIIDDNEIFREMLGKMLEATGHTVVSAPDGFEGTQLYRASPVDLIMTDMVMPHSGLSAIRVLRSEFPTLKVIAMSGGSRLLGYAKDVGAYRTLMKPFTPEQLSAAIEETLAYEPPPAPKVPKR